MSQGVCTWCGAQRFSVGCICCDTLVPYVHKQPQPDPKDARIFTDDSNKMRILAVVCSQCGHEEEIRGVRDAECDQLRARVVELERQNRLYAVDQALKLAAEEERDRLQARIAELEEQLAQCKRDWRNLDVHISCLADGKKAQERVTLEAEAECDRLQKRVEELEQEHDADMARLQDELTDYAVQVSDLSTSLAAMEKERNAYKRAKEENDERYMIERDEARQERDRLAASLAALKECPNESWECAKEARLLTKERDAARAGCERWHNAYDSCNDRLTSTQFEWMELREANQRLETEQGALLRLVARIEKEQRETEAGAARMREALVSVVEGDHCTQSSMRSIARQALASTTAGTLALGVIQAARAFQCVRPEGGCFEDCRNRDICEALHAYDQGTNALPARDESGAESAKPDGKDGEND